MPKRRDHHLPLSPDITCPALVNGDGKLVLQPPGRFSDDSGAEHSSSETTTSCVDEVANHTWMLEITYRAKGRWKLPGVATVENGEERFTQYFESNETGTRLLNLTGVGSLTDIVLAPVNCTIEPQATLYGFRRPHLEDGPILIIAPHPDDAELAAYGLYSRHPKQTWIVTLTAGERLKRLDKQYLPGLDATLEEGSRRKGLIRAWNSATTPLLASVPAEQLIMLGYFNDTLPKLLETPDATVPSYGDPALTPRDFRCWNTFALPSDPTAENRGVDLLEDLSTILSKIKPTTVLVTHPEIDPHHDHVASAKALAKAMSHSGHVPERVLLYANHLKGARGFPNGPAHAAAGVWPTSQSTSQMPSWRLHSEPLSLEAQKSKALSLDSMHDLRGKKSLERQLKRWLRRKKSALESGAWKDYGDHDFFQTHIKAHENFVVINGKRFLAEISH